MAATQFLKYGDLKAWINMEGLPSAVYCIETPQSNQVTCWIPSESGKKFSVNWSSATRAISLGGKVIIDGVLCDSHIMLDASYPNRSNSVGVSFTRTSQLTQRDFMFSTIEVTDDDAYLDTVDRTYNLGTIILELWKLRIVSVVSRPLQPLNSQATLESPIIHERSKKAGIHHTKHGEEYYSAAPIVDAVVAPKIGTEPHVRFTFRYRPMAMLMAQGIIPQPISTCPSGEAVKKVNAEIRQLEAKLKVLRAKAEGSKVNNTRSPIKKIKKEIKREAIDPLLHRKSKHPEIIDLTFD